MVNFPELNWQPSALDWADYMYWCSQHQDTLPEPEGSDDGEPADIDSDFGFDPYAGGAEVDYQADDYYSPEYDEY